MKSITVSITIGLALVLGLSHSVLATMVEKKSFNDLVVQADMVASGRVLEVTSHPTHDGQYAYTYVTVGELELLQGTYTEPTVTLRKDGGPLGDGTVLVIPGIPSFQVGEKVVLFVKGNGHQICPLVGCEQGLLRVVEEQESGQDILLTSQGRRIHTIEGGDFVVSSMAGRSKAEASAGVPDDGQIAEPASLPEPPATLDLTLVELKRQVHMLLDQIGTASVSQTQVESAPIRREAPGRRTDKPPKIHR
jgi:hypothetical protein